MNIVIPMAGRGSRFQETGIATPKPLIPVLGKPMYAWAVDGLPLDRARQLIFVVLEEHLAGTGLESEIRERYAGHQVEIIAIPEVTEGQACTVLEARALINTDEPLLIFNADTYCRSSIAAAIDALPAEAAGIISVFSAEGDRWSFVRADDEGRVLEVAEKQRVGPWASTGIYVFTRGSEFVAEAEAMIAENDRVRNEFYVAPIYSRILRRGGEVRMHVAEEVWVLGTPEDLEKFLAAHEVPTSA